MQGDVLGADASSRAVRGAAKASLAAAAMSSIALSMIGQPRLGLALAAGLVIGAFTGVLTLRALRSGLPFRMVSMTRLTIQTLLAVGIGYMLGIDVIWVPMLGLVASHVILGAVAVRGTLAAR
jgi:hypothetical protein